MCCKYKTLVTKKSKVQLVLFREEIKVFWLKYTKLNRISLLILEQYFWATLFICILHYMANRYCIFPAALARRTQFYKLLHLDKRLQIKWATPFPFSTFTKSKFIRYVSERWMQKAYLHVLRHNCNYGDTCLLFFNCAHIHFIRSNIKQLFLKRKHRKATEPDTLLVEWMEPCKQSKLLPPVLSDWTNTGQKLWLFQLSERRKHQGKASKCFLLTTPRGGFHEQLHNEGFHLGCLIQLGKESEITGNTTSNTPPPPSIFLRKFLIQLKTIFPSVKHAQKFCWLILLPQKKVLSRNGEKASSVPTASEVIRYESSAGKKNPKKPKKPTPNIVTEWHLGPLVQTWGKPFC